MLFVSVLKSYRLAKYMLSIKLAQFLEYYNVESWDCWSIAFSGINEIIIYKHLMNKSLIALSHWWFWLENLNISADVTMNLNSYERF